ncbi:MAG: hypothetical protein ACRDPY_21205 [Streptosporangiaceae bacterium]
MTSQDPRKITAAYQPWLPDGSPEPYLTSDQAAARYLAEPDEPDDDLTEPEWDDADSNRYQDQVEAAERDAALRAGHQGADPADAVLGKARGIAASIPYTLTAKAEALLDTAEPDWRAQGRTVETAHLWERAADPEAGT